MKTKKNKQLVYDSLDKLFDEELCFDKNHEFFNKIDGNQYKHIISYFNEKEIIAISYPDLLSLILEQVSASDSGNKIFMKPETLTRFEVTFHLS